MAGAANHHAAAAPHAEIRDRSLGHPDAEYNEDPVFSSLVSPTTFAARRRTIYVFFDRGLEKGVERIALGGSSQGGLYEAVRSTKPVSGTAGVAGNQAELWGDEQWQVLKKVLEERNRR